jgi:hypothetical protein
LRRPSPDAYVELRNQLQIHLPSSAPDRAVFAMLLGRLPGLVT